MRSSIYNILIYTNVSTILHIYIYKYSIWIKCINGKHNEEKETIPIITIV